MAAPAAVETSGINLNDARRYFLLLIRICFGLWLLYAGVMKWINTEEKHITIGPGAFIKQTQAMFEHAWPPAPLITLLAWLIAISEVLLALLILSGIRPRLVWSLTTALMFMLTMGLSILMMPNTADNWQFIVLSATCAALSGPAIRTRTP